MTDVTTTQRPHIGSQTAENIEPLAVLFSFTASLSADLTSVHSSVSLTFIQHKKIATATGTVRIAIDDAARLQASKIIKDFFAASDYEIEPVIAQWDNGHRQCFRVDLTRAAIVEINTLPKSMQRSCVESLGRRAVGHLLAAFVP